VADIVPEPGSTNHPEWERRVAAEMDRRARKFPASASFFVGRIFVRTLRIAAGAGISLIAYWAFDEAIDYLGKPFATLSPLELLGGIASGIFGFWIIWLALFVAFGKGKSRADVDAASAVQRRRDVELHLRQSDRMAQQRTLVYEKARGIGRYLGKLMRQAKD
jgi:hypothetical protein